MTTHTATAQHFLDLVQDGVITKDSLLEMLLNLMDDDELCEMAEANNVPLPKDWYPPLETEKDECFEDPSDVDGNSSVYIGLTWD